MSYVLDSNIVIAALNGQKSIVQRLNFVPRGEALLPAMVLAELRYGALSSQRVAENMDRIDRLIDLLVFVPVDRAIAERFSRVKADLRRQGVTKSDADLLIAATTLEVESVLVTDDRALLDGTIQGLRVENWLAQ